MSRSDVLVSPQWAQDHLDADNTVFVEVDEHLVVVHAQPRGVPREQRLQRRPDIHGASFHGG